MNTANYRYITVEYQMILKTARKGRKRKFTKTKTKNSEKTHHTSPFRKSHHVGPPFGNRFFNTSWPVGLTYWIVYLIFFCILTYAIIYVLIHHIIFWLYLHFLNILNFFKYSCTFIFHRRSLCTFYYAKRCRCCGVIIGQTLYLDLNCSLALWH